METLYFGNVGEHKKKRQKRKKNCRRNQIQIIKIRAKKRQAHDWWQKEYRTLLQFVRFCVRSDSIGCPFTPAKPSRRCQSLVAYTVRVICVLMQPFNSCRAYKIKVSSVLKYQAKKISHTFIEIGCCLPACQSYWNQFNDGKMYSFRDFCKSFRIETPQHRRCCAVVECDGESSVSGEIDTLFPPKPTSPV